MDPDLQQENGSLKSGVLTLCGTQGCCPTVDFSNPNEVVFRDDNGGKVSLNLAEWGELKQFVIKSSQG